MTGFRVPIFASDLRLPRLGKASCVPIATVAIRRWGKNLLRGSDVFGPPRLGKNYMAERTTKHPKRRGSFPVPSRLGTKPSRERTVSS